MTKVTILGEEPQKKELKKIEFVHGIDKHINKPELYKTFNQPSFYEEIKVIKRYSPDIFDLFICYTKEGYIHTFLGHFNDGVV